MHAIYHKRALLSAPFACIWIKGKFVERLWFEWEWEENEEMTCLQFRNCYRNEFNSKKYYSDEVPLSNNIIRRLVPNFHSRVLAFKYVCVHNAHLSPFWTFLRFRIDVPLVLYGSTESTFELIATTLWNISSKKFQIASIFVYAKCVFMAHTHNRILSASAPIHLYANVIAR